jgi:hypothetical protein
MTTFANLTLPGFEPMGSGPSTPSAGASRAKTSRWLAAVQVLMEREAASGERSPVWLASFDPASRSWRTSGLFALEDSPKFSRTLPRSGMSRNGTLYQLPPLVRLIYATGSGSSRWLPTPTAQDSQAAGGQRCTDEGRRGLSLHGAAARGLIPTPTAQDADASGSRNTTTSRAHSGTSLTDWARRDGGMGRLLPTPSASDERNAADYSDGSRGHSPQLRHLGRGRLNHRFVAWMMGFPPDWLDLD